MKIQESGEMYLETILILSKEKADEGLHAVDICEYMGYSKPSVSRALGLLKKSGHVEVDDLDHITLTESGRAIASKIYERHNFLAKYLESLGVSKETADADACKIEHNISDETFNALKRHVEKNAKK